MIPVHIILIILHSDHGITENPQAGMGGAGFLFDATKLQTAVDHANTVCVQYGVKIISINVISAFPADGKLMNALAAGAVAAAEAEQAEVCARGRSKATMIDAQVRHYRVLCSHVHVGLATVFTGS